MKNGIEILPGHFAKVYKDGKCVARAYAQQDGTWRISEAGNPQGRIVDQTVATSWIALQSII